MSKLRTLLFTFGASLILMSAANATHNSDASVAERIAPVGSVYLPGELAPVVEESAEPKGPRSGEQVYTAACNMCHGAGVAGAPIKGNADAWAPRIAKGKEVLYQSAINGLGGAMPARGTCVDCSDEELKAAVEYMIEGL